MSMLVFKILQQPEWESAIATGRFGGSAIDLRDGFIHLSTAKQVQETARRHFAGQHDLLLVAFDPETLGSKLKYEPSRGGDLFPHLYDTLDPALARWIKPLPWSDDGHRFPAFER